MTIRIGLVDDQDLLRLGFRMVLQAEPDLEVVGEASSGRTALTMVAEAHPDVVLMDVRMPDGDGIEATRRIAHDHPDTRVLILTTFDLDEYAFAGLRAGASGFLLKDTRPVELLSAIRSVAGGDAAVSPRVTRRMLELFGDRLQADQSPDDDRLDVLTERERQVLVAMAEGLSNTEIAQRFFVSESTVKTHVGRVLAKLGLRDRVHAVILAYETGLVRP